MLNSHFFKSLITFIIIILIGIFSLIVISRVEESNSGKTPDVTNTNNATGF